MASDETVPPEGQQPFQRPPRERHREPPVIDGTAEPVPGDGEATTASPEQTFATQEPSVPEAKARRTFPTLLFAVAMTTVFAACTGYLAWQQSDEGTRSASVMSDLRARLERMETRPVPSQSSNSAGSDQFTGLDKRISALEQRPAPSSAPPVAVSALEARIAGAEKLARDAAAAAASAQRASEATRTLTAGEQPSAPAPLVDLAPLEQRLASLEAQAAAPKSEARVQPEASANARKDDGTALAVVAQALSLAVDRGRPFKLELAAAESLGADPAVLKILQPLAASGVPSADALAKAFGPVARPIVSAAEPSTEGMGLADRLSASAAKLVRVRPAGDAAGEDPASLVSRIEAAIARSDSAAIVAAWEHLPQASKEISKGFGQLAQQRLAAERATHQLTEAAMAALAARN